MAGFQKFKVLLISSYLRLTNPATSGFAPFLSWSIELGPFRRPTDKGVKTKGFGSLVVTRSFVRWKIHAESHMRTP